MTDIQLFGLIILFIVIQINVVILNVTGLFAYFQRNRPDACKELVIPHITRAALYGSLGVFALPGIFFATEKFRYGLKFTKNENPYSDWYEIVEREYRKKELAKYKAKNKKLEIAEGRCIDIWGD